MGCNIRGNLPDWHTYIYIEWKRQSLPFKASDCQGENQHVNIKNHNLASVESLKSNMDITQNSGVYHAYAPKKRGPETAVFFSKRPEAGEDHFQDLHATRIWLGKKEDALLIQLHTEGQPEGFRCYSSNWLKDGRQNSMAEIEQGPICRLGSWLVSSPRLLFGSLGLGILLAMVPWPTNFRAGALGGFILTRMNFRVLECFCPCHLAWKSWLAVKDECQFPSKTVHLYYSDQVFLRFFLFFSLAAIGKPLVPRC